MSLLRDLIVSPLQRNGATVWIFGSRARGDHRPTSDVDILYEFPHQKKSPPGLIYSVKSELEDSRFPFTVDLVDVRDLAESYRIDVLRERKLFDRGVSP